MSTDRFHKAAKDGLLDVLREATKKDCNGRDEAGMTPTLWASFEGNLDALRLLVGRGGDPDKSDFFGNSALHLASARGHTSCVSFLVNFGANIFGLDIDDHTPQDLAGINNREDILRYLDGATAKLEASDRKKAKALKEKARKDADKRRREYDKRQAKAVKQAEKDFLKMTTKDKSSNMLSTLRLKKAKSGSMHNLSNIGNNNTTARPRFSEIVGGTMTGTRGITSIVQKKALAKTRLGTLSNGDFKIAEIEDGKRSIRSLTGVRRDSEVMYVGTFDQAGKRGKLQDVMFEDNSHHHQPHEGGTLTRSLSQPDFLAADMGITRDIMLQEPASIFDRPGMGSIAFRKSITNTLNALTPNASETGTINGEECSIGSAGSLAGKKNRSAFEDDLSYTESSDSEGPNSALERFLAAWGLEEYTAKFMEEKIDLDALMMLTEGDIKSLGLPLGHHRKLATAIAERKSALQNPGEVKDSPL
ncbi:Scaffold protein containing ankyrin repeats and SAM domain [Carabus blaptoides fortunei]